MGGSGIKRKQSFWGRRMGEEPARLRGGTIQQGNHQGMHALVILDNMNTSSGLPKNKIRVSSIASI